MFFCTLIAALFLSVVAQHFLGAVPPWGARVFLVPVIFLYGALSFSPAGMLFFAFLSGGMWDLLHAQWIEEVPELGIGWSVLSYAVLGALMSGMRPLFLRKRWEVHCLFSGLATSLLVLVEYLMISLRREPLRFDFSTVVWGRVFGAGLVALIVAPFAFFTLSYLAGIMGHQHYRPEKGDFKP